MKAAQRQKRSDSSHFTQLEKHPPIHSNWLVEIPIWDQHYLKIPNETKTKALVFGVGEHYLTIPKQNIKKEEQKDNTQKTTGVFGGCGEWHLPTPRLHLSSPFDAKRHLRAERRQRRLGKNKSAHAAPSAGWVKQEVDGAICCPSTPNTRFVWGIFEAGGALSWGSLFQVAVGQKYGNPKMACPGRWKHGPKPAITW